MLARTWARNLQGSGSDLLSIARVHVANPSQNLRFGGSVVDFLQALEL